MRNLIFTQGFSWSKKFQNNGIEPETKSIWVECTSYGPIGFGSKIYFMFNLIFGH
jgi:hypothetical protein